jgi:inorganic pyrophosphatase
MRKDGFTRLKARERKTGLVHVIIETPAGSRNKFKYDEKLGVFRLNKILPRGAEFPFDFGFIPHTRAADGDPLDLMILGDQPSIQGTLVTVRLLGAIEAEQTEKGETIRNDRLMGVPEGEKIETGTRSLNDLPKKLLDEIERFFVNYNKAEGRTFKPLRRAGPKTAAKLVDRASRKFRAPR